MDSINQNAFGLSIGKGDQRKIDIIQGAIACLSQMGIESSSLSAISKKSKVSNSHVIYYFKNKKGVIDAAIRWITIQAQSMTIDAIAQAKTPSERFRAYIAVNFDWAAQNPTHAKVMLCYLHFCTVYPKYRKTYSQIRKSGRTRISALIQDTAQEQGVKNLQTGEIESIAGSIQQLITGAVFEWITTENQSIESLKKSTSNACWQLIKSQSKE